MLRTAQIVINQVSFTLPNDTSLFSEVTLSFLKGNKVGIVGKNGSGKSILLKLLIGELMPSSGSVHVEGTIAYVPQEIGQKAEFIEDSVSKFLGFDEKINALHRILQGSSDIKDYETLNEEWDVEEKMHHELSLFGLEAIPSDKPLHLLSDGEQTRLYLTKAFSAETDFIVLDEPTNHLDSHSRQKLYQSIEHCKSGLIIVSHDRALLDLMDDIVELSSLGVRSYGGNYTFYYEQKEIERMAAEERIADAKKTMKKMKRSVQASKEKHEQRQAKGRVLRRTGSQAKIILNAMKDRSAQTLNALSKRHEHMTEVAKDKLASAEKNKESVDVIQIALPKTRVPEGKIILKLTDITFSYPGVAEPIIEKYSLTVKGPRRLALKGGNGVGKTTLIKLMMKKLMPQSGEVYVGTDAVSYLDQSLQQLNPALSVLENFMRLNPGVSEQQARLALALFLFKNVSALTLVKNLSGGERLRGMLACVLMSEHPPHLLILDEPTNHLDLHSIKAIESALQNYQGSLIVISHDETFLKNINVSEVYEAPFRKVE